MSRLREYFEKAKAKMSLDEALLILEKEYTGSWEGMPTMVCMYNQDGSHRKIEHEVYDAWALVRAHCSELRRKEYEEKLAKMPEFQRELQDVPNFQLGEMFNLHPKDVRALKRGEYSPHFARQKEMLLEIRKYKEEREKLRKDAGVV